MIMDTYVINNCFSNLSFSIINLYLNSPDFSNMWSLHMTNNRSTIGLYLISRIALFVIISLQALYNLLNLELVTTSIDYCIGLDFTPV